MVLNKKGVLLAADFETTVYKGQDHTEVWSAAYARLYHEKVSVCHSIGEFMQEIFDYRCNVICWFHNLRFDGSFILNWLLRNGYTWNNDKTLKSKEFSTLISEQNRWYLIRIKTPKATIEIRDSAKLMPMTLQEMGEAFNTEHRKLEIKYDGYRYAGCNITPEEYKYIVNDVLVLKEALEFMLNEGHTNITIGSCAISEYKEIIGKRDFTRLMPDLKEIELEDFYGACNADEYIRKTYRGGFCYKKKEIVRVNDGETYDVNSLYPSVMHSKSGNVYPIGKPHFWKGEIPNEATLENRVYFVRFKCCFELKEGMLPTLQIKGNPYYKGNEWLETSDYIVRGQRHRSLLTKEGEIVMRPTISMTMTDWNLFNEHYNITELEMLDGCWFYGRTGLFDEYIDRYMEQKQKSKGGKRTEAKLFLNNLYGKFASSDDSSYRVPDLTMDGSLHLGLVKEHDKDTGYIAIGTMITSYARDFTIRRGQLNYDIFCYSDTDSLHLMKGDVKGIDIHDTDMLKWKKESEWSSAIFLRQKTYAEFIRKKNGEKVYPHWEITAAGMPERSKRIFLATHPITDFKYGLSVHGKLIPKQIPGGVVLEDKNFTLRRR